jgi:hypothetical protein
MSRLVRTRLGILCCLGAALFAVGCGKGGKGNEKGAKVQGRLLEKGRPIKLLPAEDIVVSFSRPAAPGLFPPTGSSPVDPKDGSFAFYGPNATVGLPPGSYRVIVISQINGDTSRDRFATQFGADKTPLTAEVGPEEEQTFIIDLGTKTVKKQ